LTSSTVMTGLSLLDVAELIAYDLVCQLLVVWFW
jgi:hypothetical protein